MAVLLAHHCRPSQRTPARVSGQSERAHRAADRHDLTDSPTQVRCEVAQAPVLGDHHVEFGVAERLSDALREVGVAMNVPDLIRKGHFMATAVEDRGVESALEETPDDVRPGGSGAPHDSRTTDGIHVRLLWHPDDGQVSVTVRDSKGGKTLQLAVRDGDRALDVFHHPYAYAASDK